MRRILAFDPGEVWFGMAALAVDPRKNVIRAETRVLHMPSRSFHALINEVTMLGLPADVVCEDYRVRPVGHQRWSSGETLKAIGALRYVTEGSVESSWQVIPPGSITEVPEMVGSLLVKWSERFEKANDAEWNHAFSAWRVLFRYLMKHDTDTLMRLRNTKIQRTWRELPHWLPVTTRKPNDLLAPAAGWSYSF